MKLREMPSTVRRRDLGGEAEPPSVVRSTSPFGLTPPGAGWTRIAGVGVNVLDRGNLRLKRFLSEGDRGGDGGSEKVRAAGGEGGGGGACWRAAGSCLRNSKGAGTVASAWSCCGSGTLFTLLLRTRMVRR